MKFPCNSQRRDALKYYLTIPTGTADEAENTQKLYGIENYSCQTSKEFKLLKTKGKKRKF